MKEDKKLLMAIYALLGLGVIFYIMLAFVVEYYVAKESTKLLIIIGATIILLFMSFVTLKLEVNIGYYKCNNCNHEYKGTCKQTFLSMHIGMTRYLKCPKCLTWSWSKKNFKK